MSLKLVVVTILLVICYMTDVVECKPCNVRRWTGCRNIPKMSTSRPTLSLSSSKYCTILLFYGSFCICLENIYGESMLIFAQ